MKEVMACAVGVTSEKVDEMSRSAIKRAHKGRRVASEGCRATS